jgi:hypothetical protein
VIDEGQPFNVSHIVPDLGLLALGRKTRKMGK